MDDIVKDILRERLTRAFSRWLLDQAIKQFSFISIGPINFIVSHYLLKFSEFLYDNAALELSIFIKKEKVEDELDTVQDVIKRIENAKDNEELYALEDELEEAAYNFLTFKS